MESSYGSVAGLDVHKKSVVVVVLRGDQPGEDQATGIFGTTRFGLNELITFLRQHGVRDVAMESTAQYWRPVWIALEGQFVRTHSGTGRAGPGAAWAEMGQGRCAADCETATFWRSDNQLRSVT